MMVFLIAHLFKNCKFSHIFMLDRPAPPLPELYLSEETANKITAFIRTRLNNLLKVSQDIAMGRNSKLFFKVALYLFMISFIGGLTDFLTLGYTSKYFYL